MIRRTIEILFNWSASNLTKWRIIQSTFFLSIVLFLPFFISEFDLSFATEIFIYGLFALSLNLLMGYGGLISYGHAAFFGIAAYASALTQIHFTSSMVIGIMAGTTTALVLAIVCGMILVRVTAVYFSMLTMALGEIAYLVINRWYDVTNGDQGLQGIYKTEPFASRISYYYFVVFVVGISALILYRITKSPFGLSLRALRENRHRNRFFGSSNQLIQYNCFVLASTFCGLAGSLYAFLGTSVDPGVARSYNSIFPLLSIMLGGAHAFSGPFWGAVTAKMLELISLNFIPSLWPLVLGTILIFFTIWWPMGLKGFLQDPRFIKWSWLPLLKGFSIIHKFYFWILQKGERFGRFK